MCYLGNIQVYSKSEADHNNHVIEVLRPLRQEKLFFKKSKCHFNQSLVMFLGHVLGTEGLSKQQAKVAAVMEWPPPSTKVELQSFPGLPNY
jgi:hypothetical protein